jgi:nicotinamide-nucleotide amidase
MTSHADEQITRLAADVLELARSSDILLVTAESCTGGLIMGTLTGIAGSSDVIDRGFVTYSNAAKTDMLAVPAEMIAAYGAVSEQVARAMANGACQNTAYPKTKSGILGISVTGIAGPGGGSIDKPVGTVWFGLCSIINGLTSTHSWVEHFVGQRDDIRRATIHSALTRIKAHIKDHIS